MIGRRPQKRPKKEALIKKLSQPSGLSEEEKVKLAATVIKRVINTHGGEAGNHRFPNVICTDQGRAINQAEPGWEKTLTGFEEIDYLWHVPSPGKRL